MCKTEITPRNETLDAVLILYFVLCIILAVRILTNMKRSERVLFFTLSPEGDVIGEEEVDLAGTPDTK